MERKKVWKLQRRLRTLVTSVGAMAVLGAGLSGAVVVGGPGVAGAAATPGIYVSDVNSTAGGGAVVDVFSPNANGDVAPATLIGGASTGMNYPQGVAFDAAGNLYVANQHGASVDVFAPGATGNASPIRVITGNLTGLAGGTLGPEDLKLDAADNLYVVNSLNNSIVKFAPGANGNVPPIAVISGAATLLNYPFGLALDPAGNIYVANLDARITMFSPGANGNVAPTSTISGASTQLVSPEGLGINNGVLYATNDDNSVTEYSLPLSPGNNNLAPSRRIAGASTGLVGVSGIAFDSSDNLYVVNNGVPRSVTVFAPGANGNVAPIRTIAGANTGFGRPNFIAIPASGAVTPTGGRYTPLTPARILDTRNGTGGFSTPIGPGGTIDLQVTGQGGVPATGVSAVAMNVAVTNPTAESFLTLYPTGQARPLAANLNFVPGQTVPNLVVVKVGTGGKVSIFNNAGNTDVIADVAGWYSDPSVGNDGRYQPLTPARILDTRDGTGGFGSPIGPGASIDLQVTGQGGVPASGVSAVVMNVAVTNTSATSFLTAYPTDAARPNAANLNWVPGLTVSNRVMVKVGTGGKVTIFNNAGSTNVIADVNGYYTDASVAGTNGTYNALTPARILDTRDGTGGITGPVGPGATIDVQITGQGGVPATGVSAVILNATVTQPTANSFFTIFPTGTARPLAADLNFAPGENRPNLVVVKVGTGGKVSLFNQAGTAQVVFDVAGWFTS